MGLVVLWNLHCQAQLSEVNFQLNKRPMNPINHTNILITTVRLSIGVDQLVNLGQAEAE